MPFCRTLSSSQDRTTQIHNENFYSNFITILFGVFSTVICTKPESAVNIVLCAIALHNFLRSRVPERYIPTGALDMENSNGVVNEGSWRHDIATIPFANVPNSRKGRQPRKAEEMRDQLCNYLNGPGQVPWQWNVLI